ncbi:MAG: hypothetical protein IKN77_08865 [Paludibacteraceae bacterium]|nr:hypothetical protein [Paludibacteraceae bacterium]
MEKEEIKEHIEWASKCMQLHIESQCSNTKVKEFAFVVILLNDNNRDYSYKEFINFIKANDFDPINDIELCDQIGREQNSLTWIDFVPLKIENNILTSVCKFVPFGNFENEIDFHVSIERFRHYPIEGQKYDLNYFWEISDEDYKKREEEWCKRSRKILRKYEGQKWFAERIYKYFGKKVKILDLDKEMKAINVFS